MNILVSLFLMRAAPLVPHILQTYIKICDYYARHIRKKQFFSNIHKITCIILRNLFGLDLFSHQSCATGTLLLQKKDLSSKIFS